MGKSDTEGQSTEKAEPAIGLRVGRAGSVAKGYYFPAEPKGRRRVGLNMATLVLLRWIAVSGQTVTLFLVSSYFNFDLPGVPCALTVGALAISNIALMYAKWRRLSEVRVALIMGFDLVQLSLLVGLTGGLENPFALLLLAPVTVSATILGGRWTVIVTLAALAVTTVVAAFHLPLPWGTATPPPDLPQTYRLGLWTALAMSIVFIATYIWTASEGTRRVSAALTASAEALAREREMSSLGTLAAAAAHELGSPLSTIALVTKDLLSSVDRNSPLYEDIELLKSQSDRCREILVGLSSRPSSRTGDPFEVMPLSNLVEISAQGHVPDSVAFDIIVDETSEGPEPQVARSPEFLNGLGNFLSNAGQFAKTEVEARLLWNDEDIWVSVRDDGPGFPLPVLQNIGEPYMSTRAGKDGHMGLGVFIATTLLETIGGQVEFRNREGAEVLVYWPREVLEAGGDGV